MGDLEMSDSDTNVLLINPGSNLTVKDRVSCEKLSLISTSDETAIIWDNLLCHIISLESRKILASCSSLRGILDVSVSSSNEIYILENGRSVIRIGKEFDELFKKLDWRTSLTSSQSQDNRFEKAVEDIGRNIASAVSSSIFSTLN